MKEGWAYEWSSRRSGGRAREVGRKEAAMKVRPMWLRCLCVPACVLFFLTFALPSYDLFRNPRVFVDNPPLPLRAKVGESPGQVLNTAIRAATAAAAAFKNLSFSDRDAETWEIYHPCSARAELGPRYARRPHAKLLDPNPQWDSVLEEYSALHRTCMHSVGNVTEYFLSGATNSNCKFLIMEIQGVGLGNKVGLLVSAVLYAVLTQRVILINSYSYIPWTMCEPFLGSSWILEGHFPLPGRRGWENTMLGRWVGWEAPVWKSSAFFGKGVDATKAGRDSAPAFAVKVDHSHPEVKRFYCNTDQAYLTEATWLHFSGCLYFLPKLFAVPAFQPALEALFPDPSLALTYLLRTLMLPNNEVWEQVKREDDTLFATVDRRVGIQVRFLYGRNVNFQKASKRVNGHIKQCVAENNILPKIANERVLETNVSPARTGQTTRVLVTSLHTALYDELLEMYSKHETVSGDMVRVAQLTHREKQGFSASEDHLAMVEILLLSFVDELLVTPLSTFGGLAQAYGAILPWFIEVKKSSGSCVRAQTVDLCYQRGQFHYDCPHDADVDSKRIENVVPYIKTCLPIEESYGVQLVSPQTIR